MISAVAFLAILIANRILAAAGADGVDRIVDPAELGHLNPSPYSHLYENWTDWESWEPSPEIAELLPYYRSGYDSEGLVVYVIDYGKWSFRKLAQLSEEKREEFWKYYEQLVRAAGKDAAISNDCGMVFLTDWDGFSLKNYASTTALKGSLAMFTSFVRINNFINYGFFVNVNYASETFINIARPFVGTLLDKFEIYGTRVEKWKPRVLASIPTSQLPLKYGGVKDWKPLAPNRTKY